MQLINFVKVLVISLSLTGCSIDVEQVPVTPFSGLPNDWEKNLRAVNFGGVKFDLHPARTVGQIRSNIFCSSQLGSLSWAEMNSGEKIVKAAMNSTVLHGRFFLEDLIATPEKQNYLSELAPTSPVQISATVSNIDSILCFPEGTSYMNGSLKVDVQWELFDTHLRQIIARFRTSGSISIKNSNTSFTQLFTGAFRGAQENLYAKKEFFSALAKPQIIEPQDNKLIQIKNAAVNVSPNKYPLQDAQKSTVVITTPSGHGTAFSVGDGSFLITNRHVVGTAKKVRVTLSDGRVVNGFVEKSSKIRDVALVKLEQTRVPPIFMSKDINIAQPVFAIGAPLSGELSGTVTRGIVSSVKSVDGLQFILSDTTILPGNSGGPLLNSDGQVIGIAQAGLKNRGSIAGLNIFIPIEAGLRALGYRFD